MLITHKIFLYWLLYITIIGFCIAISIMLGLPQLVFVHDHSYLSMLLISMYGLAEILAGKQVIWLSSLHRSINDTIAWLKSNRLTEIDTDPSGSVTLVSSETVFVVKPGIFSNLLISIKEQEKNDASDSIDHGQLIDAFVENVTRRIYIGDFIGSRIVWVGILATIVGVIMAFWPFQEQGMTPDTMKSHLGEFFSGVAVAFIPTAVSFIFKIALDFNTRIIDTGLSEIAEMVMVTDSQYITPYLNGKSV